MDQVQRSIFQIIRGTTITNPVVFGMSCIHIVGFVLFLLIGILNSTGRERHFHSEQWWREKVTVP